MGDPMPTSKAPAAPTYKAAAAPVYRETFPDTDPAYAYRYEVKDAYSGADFGQNESRDAENTKGEYRVALPDGRTQV